MPWRRTDKKKKKERRKNKKKRFKDTVNDKNNKNTIKAGKFSTFCHVSPGGGGELCNSFNIYFN